MVAKYTFQFSHDSTGLGTSSVRDHKVAKPLGGGGHVGANPYAGDSGSHDERGGSHGGLNAVGSVRNRGHVYACMAYGDGDNGGSAEIALEAMLMAFEATMVVAIKSQTLIVCGGHRDSDHGYGSRDRGSLEARMMDAIGFGD